MPKALTNKQRKIIIFSVVGVLIAAVAIAAVTICSYVFRDKEVEINNNTLTEVIETAPDALGKTYDNIILPESVSIESTPSAIYTFSVQNYMPLEDVKKLAVELSNKANTYTITEDDLHVDLYKDFIDLTPPDDPNYNPNFRGSDYCEYQYVDNNVESMMENNVDGQYSVGVSPDKSFVIACPFLTQGALGYDTWEKTFEIGTDDISGVSYNVYGEQYSIQEAIDYADTLIEDYKEYLLDQEGLELKLKQVVVVKNDKSQSGEDEYSYRLRYAYYYCGTEINMGGGVHLSIDDNLFCPRQGAEIIISRRDSFTSLIKELNTSQFKAEKANDDFITLGSALDRASKILAPKFIQDVKKIDIAYIPLQQIVKHDDPDLFSSESAPDLFFRPMWRLEENSEVNMEEYLLEAVPPKRYLYIDMITGEIMLYDESKFQPALTEEMITNEKQDPTFEESWR